jgi:Skp family chaperone for outer membrane proteins
MKGILRITFFTVLLLSLAGDSAWAQGRIATVDLRKLFDGYWKTKQADIGIKEQAAEAEKEHKEMLDSYTKAKSDYQTLLTEANNQAISNDEREKRKKAAEDKLKELKDSEETIGQFERQARTRLDERRQRMRNNIVEEIRKVINAKAKAAGYALVYDSSAESANGTPFILFSNNENDLTDAVLQQLNIGAPADLPKSTEPADDLLNPRKSEKK